MGSLSWSELHLSEYLFSHIFSKKFSHASHAKQQNGNSNSVNLQTLTYKIVIAQVVV